LHASNVRWKARPFFSGMRHRARVLSTEEKCLLDRCQTQIFLAVTGL